MLLRRITAVGLTASLVMGSALMADAFPIHQASLSLSVTMPGAEASLLCLAGAFIGMARLSSRRLG